ncbi:MAG: hypothetical protein A2V99_07485 [Spirochaetes bacterium RBG_16_67_19]|nr:MAG: hypothetical protein A2064_10445 [Spirochaetes bacterium GWB1_66_5]OHD72629.1 MAG: hypothetical protein A2V99_07485 [Spirochaetes bacterium RBG_16_67_19]
MVVAALVADRRSGEEQGIDAAPFPPPTGTEPGEVCALSGEQAGPGCPSRSVEHFLPAQTPRAACSVYRRFVVDRRDGTLASTWSSLALFHL